MKRLMMMTSAAMIAFSGAAMAGPNNSPNACAPGQKCDAPHAQKSDHVKAPQAQHSQKSDHKAAPQKQAAKKHSAPGHAPTSAQLKRLPPPPSGREYRIVDDRVVTVNKDTLEVVAAVGLVSALLNN
ncbi:hypothetical protein BFP70_03070 [Thioclava sp. SK-1]|uniref:hypothetical protein n=1 Tax=Thioclava sp. SK-1 TaxID=1889770 RepID=UPI0008260843|nr:hypothetical protein [Thioclava sp. SK-1]OCX67155.1 hypothetical protein BFP70_03070 [Thioclava sp. SK-1]